MDSQKPKSSIAEFTGASIRAIASSFPIASSIATGWSEWKANQEKVAIEDLLQKFGERLNNIEQEHISDDFLKSDDAKHLIAKTAAVAADEIRAEKREMLATFLAMSFHNDLSPDQDKFDVLNVIDKLDSQGALILKNITLALGLTWGKVNLHLGSDYDPKSPDKPTFGYINESGVVELFKHQTSPEAIEAKLAFLVSLGTLETQSARGWTTVGGMTGITGYRPTKLGLRVLEYLNVSTSNLPEYGPKSPAPKPTK